MTTLDDQAEIRGKSTTVGSTGSLLVLVGGGDVVGQLSGALLDLALVVGLGVVLVLLSHGLHLIDGVHNTDERAPGHTGQGVAAGTDFTVDLETTTEAEVQKMSKIAEAGDGEGSIRPKLGDSRLVIEGLVPLGVLPRVCGRVQS